MTDSGWNHFMDDDPTITDEPEFADKEDQEPKTVRREDSVVNYEGEQRPHHRITHQY